MQSTELTPYYSWLITQARIFTSHDYEDLAHDTYLRAVRYLPSFQDGSNLKGWLYTIMHSIFINRYRDIRQTCDILHDTAIMPDAINRIELKQVNEQIDKLSGKGEALLLYANGYKYEEIAVLTNTPTGTVKARIHYARKELWRLHNDR